MNEHNDSLLVAEYALGLLDDAEAKAFEQRLSNEPELKAACLHWYEEFTSLYSQTEEVAPPTRLKANIQDRLFGDKQLAPEKPKRSFWLWPANLVSGLLLATLIGFIYQQSQQTLFEPTYTASLETEDKSLQVLASYDKTRNLLQVSSSKAAPAAGRSHELWLIAGNDAPVSLGVLSAINNENIVLTEAISAVIVGSTLAISDEPAGGSPTGSPTGAVLTTAPVTEI